MPSILQGGGKPMESAPADQRLHQPEQGGGGGEMRSTLVSGGDGSHRIEHEDGNVTEHPHIGHALMSMAGKHSEGKHYHAHSDGMGGDRVVHTSEHGGEAEGPHDQGIDEFFNEDGGEESGENDEAGKKEGKSGGTDGKDWE